MIPQGCVHECKGCRHREWTLEESLEQKYAFLKSKFPIWEDVLNPVTSVPDNQRWAYRFKTTLNAKWDENGWRFGMMSRDELIEITSCPLHKPEVNRVLKRLKYCLPPSIDFPLAFYVQTSAQVVLIVKSKIPLNCSWLTEDIITELIDNGVKGLWVHYNPSAGRRLFEKTHWELLFGESLSVDSNNLLYGPGAFQQLLPSLYYQSLDEVSAFFNLSKNVAVVDLYCGTGTSMSRWSKSGANVVGVEQSGVAVECVKLNIPEAIILRGACRQRVPQLAEWAEQQHEAGRSVSLYLNPPRTGVEQEVLDWIAQDGKFDKIAYLSCSAGTLSKNLLFLTKNGYRVCKLIPYDFFPQTIHVECLALLERIL